MIRRHIAKAPVPQPGFSHLPEAYDPIVGQLGSRELIFTDLLNEPAHVSPARDDRALALVFTERHTRTASAVEYFEDVSIPEQRRPSRSGSRFDRTHRRSERTRTRSYNNR